MKKNSTHQFSDTLFNPSFASTSLLCSFIRKKLFLLILLVTIAESGFSQKEANIWYFGYEAGLDFNSGVPVALTNSAMNQFEGCSSIADANGNLLFYTDGQTVWNKNHVQMDNGFGLGSGLSSTQAALIVKQPGNDSLYYIFTADEFNGSNGLEYNIVDINLLAGLGSVTIKNQVIYTPTTERIAACNDANGTDVWILSHQTVGNSFYAYKLTPSGLDLTPVISSVGPTFTGGNLDFLGYLKFSSQGDRVAMAESSPDNFWLFDFDNATGELSNSIQLTSSGSNEGAYGVEFSPSGLVLYGTSEIPFILYQWDLSSGDEVLINASRITIPTLNMNASYIGSLALAPDQKIYMTRNTCEWLGVINDPDIPGLACNYVDSGVYLQGKLCVYGLPNLNQSYYSSLSLHYENVCFGDSTHLFVSSSNADSLVWWDFGDPPSGAANNDTGSSVHHVFTATDTFNITIIKYLFGGMSDTAYVSVLISTIPVIDLGNDTTVCLGDTLTLDAGNPGASYLWSNGSNSQTIAVTDSNTYSVIVNNNGCKNTDSISVSFIDCTILPQPGAAVSDPTICEKFCVDFTDQSTNNPTSWLWTFNGGNPSTSTLQNPTQICYNLPGTYDVTLTASNAFGSLTQVFPNYITVYATPPFPTINQVGYTLYSSFATSYQWQFNSVDIFGATNQSYTVTQSGYYTVVVEDQHGCTNYTSVYVLISGVDDLSGSANFIITPNPSSGNFMIELLNGFMTGEVSIDVVNTIGQKVFSYSEKISAVDWKKELELNDVARGIYFLEIKTQTIFLKKKIIITN